jgi:ABC-type nitrate/sulfonate/bicarbonate transport system substrate-binding protein
LNQIDIAGTFLTPVMNLNNKNGSVIAVIASSGSDEKTFGEALVLENGPIRRARDLLGKKVGVNTFGAAQEAEFKEYLRSEGITSKEDIDKLELIVIPTSTYEQAIRSGQIATAILRGVAKDKALDAGGLRSLFSDESIYHGAVTNVTVMRKDFLEKYPNATRKFITATADIYEWARVTPIEEVIDLMNEVMVSRDLDENPEILQFWKSFGVPSKGGLIQDSDVQRWIDWLVFEGQLEEGRVKPYDNYTNEFNPYFTDAGRKPAIQVNR